jgi:tRNA-uridine 2-sulfurtransferase
MKNLRGKKVYVGLSGGVDSSVAAALLLEAGADVTGVFIKGWYPEFLKCDWKEERRDAMRVAAHLGIPFFTCDAEDAYKKNVIDYMISEYKAGRTPNPDVMCNKYVKFGTFFDFAMKHEADFVATGHYARSARIKNEKCKISNDDSELTNSAIAEFVNSESNDLNSGIQLMKGEDGNKDQSYFLWAVSKEQLDKTLFPIGEIDKTEVRKIARKYKLFTGEKKDSQGLCFLGKVDLDEFLSHYIPKNKGDVLNKEGEVIGHHDGVHLYTLGERHGFTVTKKGIEDKPYYIVAKDLEKNTLTVSDSIIEIQKTSCSGVVLSNVNWTTGLELGKEYMCRSRYRQALFRCSIHREAKPHDAEGYIVNFVNKQDFVSTGQSLVVYDGDVCLGGGIIEAVI